MPVALVLPLAAALLAAHPLHTTHTDLVESGREVTVQVRAFSDDLHLAVRKREGAVDDSATARYVRGTVSLVDSAGHPVPLTWVGQEAMGDVTLLRFRAAPQGGLSGARVCQAMHMELFEDQVNVLQASYGGRRVSLLFVPGDTPKRLP
jgi:hypothetical protein